MKLWYNVRNWIVRIFIYMLSLFLGEEVDMPRFTAGFGQSGTDDFMVDDKTNFRPTLKEVKSWLVDEDGYRMRSLEFMSENDSFTIHITKYFRGERETRRDRLQRFKTILIGTLSNHNVYINSVTSCYMSAGCGYLTLHGVYTDSVIGDMD